MVNDELSTVDGRKNQSNPADVYQVKPQAPNFNAAAPSAQPKGNIEIWGCRATTIQQRFDFIVHLRYNAFIESAFMWSCCVQHSMRSLLHITTVWHWNQKGYHGSAVPKFFQHTAGTLTERCCQDTTEKAAAAQSLCASQTWVQRFPHSWGIWRQYCASKFILFTFHCLPSLPACQSCLSFSTRTHTKHNSSISNSWLGQTFRFANWT